MKKIIIIILAVFAISNLQAQVKIGENPTTINENSLLEMETKDKGMLLPRVELEETTKFQPLKAHIAGMTVYNTATAGDVTPGYYYNDGTKWVRIADATEDDASKDAWIDDNANTMVKLETKSDGITAREADTEVIITDEGKVGIGNTSPISKLHITAANGTGVENMLINEVRTTKRGWMHYPYISVLKNHTDDPNVKGPTVDGEVIGEFSFVNYNLNGDLKNSATIQAIRVGPPNGAAGQPNAATMLFYTASGIGQEGVIPRMAISHIGNVGIGNDNPTEKLEVAGSVKIGNGGDTATPGTIRYNEATDKFQGYTTSGWVDLH